MSTFLSLPNELSFQIFHDLDGEDLLALAKSCRHLNIIVIPYYLSRHNITNPPLSITLDSRNSRIFAFLVISVQLTSIDTIDATFSPYRYSDIIRLEYLINKLTSVGSVQLSLCNFGPFRNQTDGDHFIQAMHSLLTSIIARSCVSLTAHGPDVYLPFAEEQHNTTQKPSSRFIASLVQMLQRSPPKQDVCDGLVLDASHASKLVEFRIDSSMLFHPLFLYWAIKHINASPITTLSFTNSSLRSPLWDDLLSTIVCPTLSEFCITDHFRKIPFSSLDAFLARHQTITSLECKGLFQHDHGHPRISLPRLTKLVSTYEFFVHLLKHATAFPSLRDITLKSFPRERSQSFSPSVVIKALEGVRRCPNELELSLMFEREKGDLTSWLDVDPNDDSRVERSLRNVVSLNLLIGTRGRGFSDDMLRVLPKWLRLFPALRIVTFQCYLPKKRASLLNFAHSIIQACSQLDTLTINEECHTAVTWLAMEDFH